MPLELVLNELSLNTAAPTPMMARERMLDFLETVRQATRRRADKALRTDRDLNDIQLAPNYPVQRWRNDPEVEREWKQFFRTLTSKVPYLDGLPLIQERAYGMDCKHNGATASGLLAAYLLDGLPVSMRSEPAWDTPIVRIALEQLVGDEIDQIDEALRHASHQEHIIHDHDSWIAERVRLAEPRDGAQLWSQCAERYPTLQFCTVVETHLRQYGAGAEALSQIMKRLVELERYALSWITDRFDPDAIGSKVTPESPETLKQFGQARTFLCPDGVERLFSWHARFTPGAGRLYFHPDEERHTITIGYIGQHLPTQLYRT
jgi:hypothetical protein